ncbi:MAG: hypothetical protein IIB27_02585 [Chloroflexi bacterium]|nr:hypothetical protein [Chloroflexota bacterium]
MEQSLVVGDPQALDERVAARAAVLLVEIGEEFTPITESEIEILKKEARTNTPLFVHPAA